MAEIKKMLQDREMGDSLPYGKLFQKATIRYLGRILKFKLMNKSKFDGLKTDQKEILTQIKKNGYAVIPNFFDPIL